MTFMTIPEKSSHSSPLLNIIFPVPTRYTLTLRERSERYASIIYTIIKLMRAL